MAFSICSKIGIPNSTFCGSTRELSCSGWSTSTNMDTRGGPSLASHWRPSATVGSATHGGSSKQHKETEYPTLSMSYTSSSLHGEDWWKRPSSRQFNHSSVGFPCDSFDTHASSPSMTLGDGWNFEGNPFAPSSSSWSSLPPPPPPPSSSSLNSPKVYPCLDACTCRGSYGGVPVFVMLPLDSVSFSNKVTRKRAMNASLMALKSAGVKGVMMDVWWGIVEKDEPGNYDWTGYKELVDMVRQFGLKVQAVMSFHQSGSNGDSCFIPLPQWVAEEIRINPEILYTDRLNRRSSECISLGCDTIPVLRGRSPVQVYTDYMRSFRDNFRDHLGNTIVEILVGMGPGGELRYPSYSQSAGVWRFPGIGEFQCYDKYMLASLRAAAEHVGVFRWGYTGPYFLPESSEFFESKGAWNSPYGKFFLEWYSGMLLAHGERILTAAEGIFRDCRVKLSGKVAGIHWHYSTHSHAAELTAGYYNTVYRDGYLPIVQMFARHGVMLNVSCIEMRDVEQPMEAMCSPERLIRQVVLSARQAGVSVSGENALPRFDVAALKQVIRNSRLTFHDDPQGVQYEPMHAFTFLRMSPALFQSHNWRNFVPFVREMAQGQPSPNEWDGRHRAAKAFLHDIRSLVFAYH